MKISYYLIVLSMFIASCNRMSEFCPNTCKELAMELAALNIEPDSNGIENLDAIKNSSCYSCVNENSLIGVPPGLFSLIFNDRFKSGRSIVFDSLLFDVNMIALDSKFRAGAATQCSAMKEMQLSYLKNVVVNDTIVLSLPITRQGDKITSFPLISCLGEAKVESWFKIKGVINEKNVDSNSTEGFGITVLEIDYPADIAGKPLKLSSTFHINFRDHIANVFVKP